MTADRTADFERILGARPRKPRLQIREPAPGAFPYDDGVNPLRARLEAETHERVKQAMAVFIATADPTLDYDMDAETSMVDGRTVVALTFTPKTRYVRVKIGD